MHKTQNSIADLHKQALCHWSAGNRGVIVQSSVGPNRHGGLITKGVDSAHSGVAQHWIVGSELTQALLLFLVFAIACSLPSVFVFFWKGLQTHNDGPHALYPSATMRFDLLLLRRLCHVNFLPGLTLDSGHYIYSAASATKPLHNRAELLHVANKRGFNGLAMADQFILMRVGWRRRWWCGGHNGITLVSLIKIHFVSGRSETCN